MNQNPGAPRLERRVLPEGALTRDAALGTRCTAEEKGASAPRKPRRKRTPKSRPREATPEQEANLERVAAEVAALLGMPYPRKDQRRS